MKKIAAVLACMLTLSSYVYSMELSHLPKQENRNQARKALAEIIKENQYTFPKLQIAYSADYSKIALLEENGRISVWDAKTQKPIDKSVVTVKNRPIEKWGFHQNGVCICVDGIPYSIVPSIILEKTERTNNGTGFTFKTIMPDHTIVLGIIADSLFAWNAKTGELIAVMATDLKDIISIYIQPDRPNTLYIISQSEETIDKTSFTTHSTAAQDTPPALTQDQKNNFLGKFPAKPKAPDTPSVASQSEETISTTPYKNYSFAVENPSHASTHWKKSFLGKIPAKKARLKQTEPLKNKPYAIAPTLRKILSEEIEYITDQSPLSVLLKNAQAKYLAEKIEEPNENTGFLRKVAAPNQAVLLGVYPNQGYSLIALIEETGRVSVWDTATQKLINGSVVTIPRPIQECRFDTDNERLWINSEQYSFVPKDTVRSKEYQEEPPLKKQKLSTDQEENGVPVFPYIAIPYTAAIEKKSLDGALIARIDTRGSLSVWNTNTEKIINSSAAHNLQNVTGLSIDASNGTVLVATSTKTCVLYSSYDIISAKTFEAIQNWLCS